MKENCLNCKYEPDWDESSDWFQVRIGDCKWPSSMVKLPSCHTPTYSKAIQRFSDDSGIFHNCPTWRRKEGKS